MEDKSLDFRIAEVKAEIANTRATRAMKLLNERMPIIVKLDNAIFYGSTDALALIEKNFEDGKFDQSTKNEILFTACLFGEEQVMNWIIEKGANIHFKKYGEISPLMYVVSGLYGVFGDDRDCALKEDWMRNEIKMIYGNISCAEMEKHIEEYKDEDKQMRYKMALRLENLGVNPADKLDDGTGILNIVVDSRNAYLLNHYIKNPEIDLNSKSKIHGKTPLEMANWFGENEMAATLRSTAGVKRTEQPKFLRP